MRGPAEVRAGGDAVPLGVAQQVADRLDFDGFPGADRHGMQQADERPIRHLDAIGVTGIAHVAGVADLQHIVAAGRQLDLEEGIPAEEVVVLRHHLAVGAIERQHRVHQVDVAGVIDRVVAFALRDFLVVHAVGGCCLRHLLVTAGQPDQARMEQRHVLNEVKISIAIACRIQPKGEGQRSGLIGLGGWVGSANDADHDVWVRRILEQPDIIAIDRANAAVHADGGGKWRSGVILRQNDRVDGFPGARRGLHEIGLIGDLR